MHKTILDNNHNFFSNDKELFRTVLKFEIQAEAHRNPDVAAIMQHHDAQMRRRFMSILRQAGIDDAENRMELIFTIFSGPSAWALRHLEQEGAAFHELVKDVILKALGDRAVTSDAACD